MTCSAFEKLRVTSDESYKNMSDEWDKLKPNILQEFDQIREKMKRPDYDSIYYFTACTCPTNISKELTELVIEELITPNAIFNKTSVQGLDSLFKLNEKELPIPIANSFLEIYETQPNTSDNDILESFEEEYINFDNTPSNDIQTPTLQKSVSSENLETPQDITNIRA